MSTEDPESKDVDVELILQRMERWASVQPDEPLFNFYKDDGETLLESYTYRDFNLKTEQLARALVADKAVGGHGMQRGSFAMLVYPPSLDFMVAFFACLKAGVVAVPVFPPDPNQLRKSMYVVRGWITRAVLRLHFHTYSDTDNWLVACRLHGGPW